MPDGTGASTPRVAAVGGGHGLSRALLALRHLDLEPSAVVTVADDGGSSGRLRRDLGIIAPGDLRMALTALAERHDLASLFAHRFRRGELEGHALGNLALVALAEQYDEDFVAALDAAGGLLGCRGRVLPATATPVQLKAIVAGQEVDGQARVTQARRRVERVWLEPENPPACREALAALAAAEGIVVGPGSLFTSVIATLLVPELAAALRDSLAGVVYVANLTTQPGETTGLDIAAHLDALLEHVPGMRLRAVVVHDGPVAPGSGAPLAPLSTHPAVEQVVRGDVAARDERGELIPGHDPARLARALAPLLGVSPS